MKVVVAVCVYNRFDNIKKWLLCWRQYNHNLAVELVIIHNHYGDEKEKIKFKTLCETEKIRYVPFSGQGFDIGRLQDVFKGRLAGFPEWDYLLWCTDDVLPMIKDFISPFIKKIKQSGVGVAAMQLSASVSPHFRTSGFCISKKVASKIEFPTDHITTKAQCYTFEHRGGDKTFTNQIRQMGLSCEQVAPIETSPLWDSDHPNVSKRLGRREEFNHVWGFQDKVVFITPIFDAFPEIISSLMCQSNQNWELLLIDDNPQETICKAIVEAVNDKRIKYIKRKREANYGHPHRRWALNELKEGRLSDAGFVVVTNADNFYTPNFIHEMLGGFKKNPLAIASYCSDMVHSYINWKTQPCRLERGHIDCGGTIIRRDAAVEAGWESMDHSSDWTYFDSIIKKHGANKWEKVPGTMFVHN